MFWITVIAGVLIVAFYMAMNTANIYILLKDGMEARAGVVLMDRDATELQKFFREDFLRNDQVLSVGMSERSPYANYEIRGFDHRLSMEWMWAWPWDIVARATITERIPRIDGRVKSSRREEMIAAGGESAEYPPRWKAGRYSVTLERISGQWKISSVVLIEDLEEETVASPSTEAPPGTSQP